MGRLYINDINKNDDLKYRVLLNGIDMTDAYKRGELQGIHLEEGYYDIAIFEGTRRPSYFVKPKNTKVYIGQNEDVSFLIEVSKLNIAKTISQGVFSVGIFSMLFVSLGARYVFKPNVDYKKVLPYLPYFLYLMIGLIFLVAIPGLVLFILRFYLIILQNKYKLVETSRVTTQ